MKMKKFKLGWGNSVVVREAFISMLSGRPVTFDYKELEEMDYTDHFGDPELVEVTKKIIERQIGKKYDHVFLTAGGTGAITVSLRAFEQKEFKYAITRKAPFYPLYPNMIRTAGLYHLEEPPFVDHIASDSVNLIDSPSAPYGHIYDKTSLDPTILDAVYGNNVYTNGMATIPAHDILVGSYSKLTGLNGIRIGWVATNDPLLAERLKILIEAEYGGLDKPGMYMLLEFLKRREFNWDGFETIARYHLNYNREQWSKLERFFEGQPVSLNGMFYYGKVDKNLEKLLIKSNIEWIKGSVCGHLDTHGRFNIGQSMHTIKDAVKTILKNDKI